MYIPWRQSIIACKIKWRHSEHQHLDKLLAMEPSGGLSSYTNIPLKCYTKKNLVLKESPWKNK